MNKPEIITVTKKYNLNTPSWGELLNNFENSVLNNERIISDYPGFFASPSAFFPSFFPAFSTALPGLSSFPHGHFLQPQDPCATLLVDCSCRKFREVSTFSVVAETAARFFSSAVSRLLGEMGFA